MTLAHPDAAAEPAAPKVRRGEPVHIPALDGVRGLAVLLVMFHHFAYGAEGTSLPAKLVVWFAEGGWMGVDLFFVLSGFLITGILLDARNTPHYYRNFYARRTLRIFPLYYGYLFVMCVIVARILHLDPQRSDELLSYQHWLWLYVSNVLICIRGSFLVASVNHFWTLAIEEHFYLIWPTVVRWVEPRRMWLACLACIAVALAARIGFHVSDVWRPAPMVFTLCRIDALAMGGLLCVLARSPEHRELLRRGSRWALLLTAPVVLLFLLGGNGRPLPDAILRTVGYSLIALFCAGFLCQVLLSEGALKRWLVHPVLRTFGIYAYGLYVFHHPIRIILQRALPFENLGQAVGSYWLGLALHSLVALALSVGVALASYHLYEKQFLKLKRFFTYRSA